jgi:hypothetical protein
LRPVRPGALAADDLATHARHHDFGNDAN